MSDPNFRAPLLIDQDFPYVGNSPGDDGRGRVHVKVSNKSTEAIPVNVVDSEPGEPLFQDFDAAVSGTGPHTLIDYTVPADTKLFLSHLEISCRLESNIRVEKNGDLIGSGATAGAHPHDVINWIPRRECVEGDNIKVLLTKRSGSPDVDIGAHLMGLTTPT
jgi:hypothetical protein